MPRPSVAGAVGCLLLVHLAFACEDGPAGPPPPEPLRQPLRPPDSAAPARPALQATAGEAAPDSPEADAVLVASHRGERHFGVEGTAAQATAWVLELPSPQQPDPVLKTGAVAREKLERFLRAVDSALPFPQFHEGVREPNLWVRRRGAMASTGLQTPCPIAAGPSADGGTPRCPAHEVAALVEALATAEATVVETATTEVFVPTPTRATPAGRPECEDDGEGPVCHGEQSGKRLECHPGSERGELFCVEGPFATSGVRVRLPRRVVLPFRDRAIFAAELATGVSCKREQADVRCSDGSLLGEPVFGPQRWFAESMVRDGRHQLVGRPMLLARVHPHGAQRRAGASVEVPQGGPFEIAIASGNGLSGWGQRATIRGTDRGAQARVETTGPRRRGKGETESRQGSLDARAVRALWSKLTALNWPELPPVRSTATDTTRTTLYLRRGDVEIEVASDGGCDCFYRRPTEEAPACKCPTQDAIAAVLAAVQGLPKVKSR